MPSNPLGIGFSYGCVHDGNEGPSEVKWRVDWAGALAQRPWLIVPTVAALHLTYAAGLLSDMANYDISHITAIYLITSFFGALSPPIFVFVAIASLVPMVVPMKAEHIHICLWPQQTVLFIMTVSMLAASSRGHYPDGTIKNGFYIYVDQSWTLYLTLAHLAATLRNAKFGRDFAKDLKRR